MTQERDRIMADEPQVEAAEKDSDGGPDAKTRLEAFDRASRNARGVLLTWYRGANPEGFQYLCDLLYDVARTRRPLCRAIFAGTIEGMLLAARQHETGYHEGH